MMLRIHIITGMDKMERVIPVLVVWVLKVNMRGIGARNMRRTTLKLLFFHHWQLLRTSSPLGRNTRPYSSLHTSRLSSLGIAFGYIAGITLLLLTLIPVTLLKGSTYSLRIAIGASGVWWAFFTVPAGWLLPSKSFYLDEEGSLSDTSTTTSTDSSSSSGRAARRRRRVEEEKVVVSQELENSWIRLFQMLKPSQIRRLSQTFLYLLAWFLLSDGFTTITSTAILFAKTTLHMSASALVIVGVITSFLWDIGSSSTSHYSTKIPPIKFIRYYRSRTRC